MEINVVKLQKFVETIPQRMHSTIKAKGSPATYECATFFFAHALYKPFRYGYLQFENVNDTTRNVRSSFPSIFNAQLPITFFSFVFKGYLTEIEED